MPFLVERLFAHLGQSEARFELVREPLYGWVTNCVGGDPMADLYTPLDAATSATQRNATSGLAVLDLRPEVRASVDRLADAAASISAAKEHVARTIQCDVVHSLYEEAHTGVCCDLAYGLSAIWAMRFVCIIGASAASVAAIAGYKRFRKKLWGPYAAIQAVEVGSYL